MKNNVISGCVSKCVLFFCPFVSWICVFFCRLF
jgi:hypothetical protein